GNVSGAFTVLKFEGASGAELWRHGIHGTSNSSDERPNAVAVDGGGNVVAAGAIWNTGTALDFTVIKLDGETGAELWRQVIDGASSGNDWANQVTVDGAGNAVAVGQTNNTVPNWSQDRADFTVIKFDGASGTELWRQVIDGAGNGDDFALAVAVDAAGDVVSVGATKNNSAGDDDFIVVKLNGADGGDFVGSGEPAPGPAVENVVWTSIVNATATGNSLQKTSGCDGCDDAGAISLQKITSGGGYIEFMVSETGTLRYVGLSNGSFSTGATEIDFAIAIGWGWAEVRENGAFRANTTAVAGDLFRILAEAGMVKYYKNGALVYLSAVAPAYPLVLDTSLFNVGAAVNNAVIAGTLDSGGGSGSDTTAPVISNVASSSVSSNGATITWTTDEPSDSQVEYGTTTAYGNSTPLDPSLVTSHTQTLSALA
ncbi:MAG: hypothetical protein HYU27_10470, partial [Acidobacteria bacterium]|nr:hypothetical protein [Acidobacteriota bacterium]